MQVAPQLAPQISAHLSATGGAQNQLQETMASGLPDILPLSFYNKSPQWLSPGITVQHSGYISI
jgi:hypothetical protein